MLQDWNLACVEYHSRTNLQRHSLQKYYFTFSWRFWENSTYSNTEYWMQYLRHTSAKPNTHGRLSSASSNCFCNSSVWLSTKEQKCFGSSQGIHVNMFSSDRDCHAKRPGNAVKHNNNKIILQTLLHKKWIMTRHCFIVAAHFCKSLLQQKIHQKDQSHTIMTDYYHFYYRAAQCQ